MFWYEDEIKRLEKQRAELNYQPETLFYGSSSIRLWTGLADDFRDFKPVNLGFGGSTLAACTWFFDRVMVGYEPKRLVLYAGDNDLGDGRHPEEVFIFFQEFAERVTRRFGSLPCYFVSLKPSINRWPLVNQFNYTNEIIAAEIKNNRPDWRWIDIFGAMLNANGRPNTEYYSNDGLHLSEKGYLIWKNTIQNALISR
jgi:lysophospholipase L1-like esterase